MGVVAIFYLLPSFIAVVRRRPRLQSIIAVNLLLGWTVAGWVWALVWSLHETEWLHWSGASRLPCPSCGHMLKKSTRRCRRCGYTLVAKQ